MSAYVLFHLDVTNPDVFQAHGKSVVQSAQEYKGEFLIPPTEAKSLEGEPPRSMNVILRCPFSL